MSRDGQRPPGGCAGSAASCAPDRRPTGDAAAAVVRGGRHARLGDGHGCERGFCTAQTLTWIGGTGPNWSTRQNWIPAEIPARGDDLIFPTSANLVTINDLTDLSVSTVTIRDNYTISGLPLEITGDLQLVSLQDVTATMTLDVTLTKEPVHVGAGDGTLVLSGVVTSNSFEKAGVGTLVLANANDVDGLVGEANCGLIRATHALALGPSSAGQLELREGCTLRIEVSTELDKPIILNGNGALGHTGVLVIAEGVTLTEKVDLQSNSAATISVLSGATLDLPDASRPSGSIHR